MQNSGGKRGESRERERCICNQPECPACYPLETFDDAVAIVAAAAQRQFLRRWKAEKSNG